MAADGVLATGLVDGKTQFRIYDEGTFAWRVGFGKWSQPDQLLGFEHDMDSMRRKSSTGRGAAALMTGGLSLAASNNRGVAYVTVTGARTGIKTYTTRNPGNTVLTSLRRLDAAAQKIIARPTAEPTGGASVPGQLQKLADLHASGALSAEEFAVAKSRLLA